MAKIDNDYTEQPVQQKYVDDMNMIANALTEILPENTGFSLFLYEFGEPHEGRRLNFISNTERSDNIAILKELLAKWEGGYVPPSGGVN